MTDTQSHNESNLTGRLVKGAIASDSATGEPDKSGATSDMPMIVWLRGDENLCEDFSLSADDVMDQLGIKRSRLTQISGRELRVGRMRAGRYIKPVYRQADVDEYLAWTRPTAAHKRSSDAIREAVDELQEHTRDLTNRFDRISSALTGEINEKLGTELRAGRREIAAETAALRRTLARTNRNGLETAGTLAAVRNEISGMKDILAAVPFLVQSIADLKFTAEELAKTLKNQGDALTALSEHQNHFTEEVMHFVEGLEMREAKRVDHLLQETYRLHGRGIRPRKASRRRCRKTVREDASCPAVPEKARINLRHLRRKNGIAPASPT